MTCSPPASTADETLHLLTYDGARKPSEFLWRKGLWNTPGTGYGTKPSAMSACGWRYHGPAQDKEGPTS